MAPRVRDLFFALFAIAQVVLVVFGDPAADLIPALPGQPTNVAFRQYAGYITVDETNGRKLFYYFVEAPTESRNKPLALWLNGGPGCSSLGGGAFSELGPFYPSKSGQALVPNPNSWVQEANIIFLESPAGVGFSYSNNTSDYSTNDAKTAQDSLTFLLKWLAEYPEYQNSDLYVTGESYAGHYVPQLAAAILKNNKVSGQLKIQLKGILVGNPLFDRITDLEYAPAEYAWGHGMVSEATHDIIVKECKFSTSTNENQACKDAQILAMGPESTLTAQNSYIDPYDVLEDVCLGDVSQQAHKLLELAYDRNFSLDPCISDEVSVYLNLQQVQTTLHAKPTEWEMCSAIVNYAAEFSTPIAPVLSDLIKSGLRVWVFSGDADSVVPVVGTRKIINSLAQDLQLKISADYKPWFQGKQVGGWSISWNSLTFATVRGAGHMVARTQPPRSLQLFSSFIAGTTLPMSPTKL